MESAETGSQQAKPAGGISRKGKIVVGVVVLAMVAGAVWITGLGPQLVRQATYVDRPPTFSGDSQKLEQTVIVPTLDSPCPPGKNVIWCSSFQLAWNEMKDKVIGAPLQVVGAEEVAARLNAAKQSASDLDPKSFYIAGGWIKDGIVGKIEKDMAARFPSHVLPDFNDYTDGILSYSYLTANVPFRHPFLEIEQGFSFTDSKALGPRPRRLACVGRTKGDTNGCGSRCKSSIAAAAGIPGMWWNTHLICAGTASLTKSLWR